MLQASLYFRSIKHNQKFVFGCIDLLENQFIFLQNRIQVYLPVGFLLFFSFFFVVLLFTNVCMLEVFLLENCVVMEVLLLKNCYFAIYCIIYFKIKIEKSYILKPRRNFTATGQSLLLNVF